MNIDGIYKVNIEQTVRKIGETERASIQRMLSQYLGDKAAEIPSDPKREEKFQKMIAEYEKDELATTMRLEIGPDRAAIRSTDGDGDYRVKTHKISDDGKVSMIIEFPDGSGDMQWDITPIGDRLLIFTGENEMSGFVWERV
jgi:hypothetical protein